MPEEPSATGPAGATSLGALVAQAVLAPSSHNTQPWLFELAEGEITLIADRSRALPVNDPEGRELEISCGAALFNLRVAAAAAGEGTRVDLLPEGPGSDVLARLYLGQGAPMMDEGPLAAAIGRRHTSRKPFGARPLPDSLLARLSQAAEREGAWLHQIADPRQRSALAELVAEGDRRQFGDRRWRRELASWMRAPGRGDGLAIAGGATPLVRQVIRALNVGRRVAAADRKLAEEAPALAALGTERDAPRDWLRSGAALERMLLVAAGEGVQAGFLNQPCQVKELRPRLRELLGRPGSPQLVLRFGFPGGEPSATARRPVDAVLRLQSPDTSPSPA